MTRFPKLLVATEFSPNAAGGGPSVVRQMLKKWPTNKVYWWSCLPDHGPAPFHVAAHRVGRIPPKLFPHSRFVTAKVWGIQRLWVPWAAQHLRSTINRYQPDVIWTVPHQWSILPLAQVLPLARFDFHISVHDYPAHHEQTKFGAKVIGRLFRGLEKLYNHARSRDAIGEEMAADLFKRTGLTAEEILNAGVEHEDFTYLEQTRSPELDSIRIAHAGTIIAEETFVGFVESLSRIQKRLSKRIELHLFGSHTYRNRSWFRSDWMIEHGNISSEEFRRELQKCVWGVSPMEFTNQNPLYNQFSLPSKTVRYLAAGLAVISLGHRDSTMANLARKYRFGVALEDINPNRIDQLLENGLGLDDPWATFRAEILRCARERFDADSMRSRLYSLLGVSEA